MGTRSLTFVKEDGKALVAIYRQYDGYISGQGRDLANILKGRRMVNGIPGAADSKTMFNGPGCMSAQIVRQLKGDEAGGIYIVPVTEDTGYVDYVYTINTNREGKGFEMTFTNPLVTVECWGKEIFKGTVDQFIAGVENNTIEQ
jgi:hypothetical protein